MAQDTFLSAYKNASHFDGQNERAWLCRIATNKCIDHLKRAGRRQIPTGDDYFAMVPSNQPTPEDEYLAEELKKKLYDSCLSLKPPYRDVALSYFYYEIDIGELATKTGKNIKTLQTQIYRAKAMLKTAYRKEADL